MTTRIIFAASMLLLFTATGCRSFRDMFSRTPESMKRSAPAKKKPQKRPAKPGETGDKLFDTVFHRGKPVKVQPITSSELNDRERALVEGAMGASRYPSDDPEIRRINERNRKSRNKRSDDVFGTKNGKYF